MIEPHSAQLGASAWAWKLTLVAPRFRVIPPVPLAFEAFPLPLAAWPLPFERIGFVAMTAIPGESALADDPECVSAATAVDLGASGARARGSGDGAGAGSATAEVGAAAGLPRLNPPVGGSS